MVLPADDMESTMMRYSRLVVILTCIFVTGILYAESAADKSEVSTTPQTEPEKHSPPVKQAPRQTTKPATTFKPSEKIGADSAVSFPVDI
jgi:hypothetical protein